jgi:5-methyltetrahydrofolate--homocysteine methyltransferase
VDIIGLSGLITPSLDEMVTVAKAMEKEKMDIPLLIGGATTSKIHTAVKIEEHYPSGHTVYVLDASRSVNVASKLLGKEKNAYVQDIQNEYSRMREHHKNRRASKEKISWESAKANRQKTEWNQNLVKTPNFTGVKVFNTVSLEEIKKLHRLDTFLSNLGFTW